MSTFIFYTTALLLCGVSTILIQTATSFSLPQGASAMMKPTLRVAGRVLIAVAAVSAGMGVFAQFLAAHH